MGKRCRQAAWGATFALIVAACAATEASPQSDLSAPRSTIRDVANASSTADPVVFPVSLADTSFVQASQPDGPCAVGDDSQLTVFDPEDGSQVWSLAIPRPSGLTAVDDTTAYVAFRWDRGQNPGIGAVDLERHAPIWQRFFETEPEQLVMSKAGLIVVTRDAVRALDPATGADLWVNDSDFDVGTVVLNSSFAFTSNSTGVHAIALATGHEVWELPVKRPDTLAADDDVLVVATGTQLIAVDIDAQSRLLDISVNRLGAGQLWVSPSRVSVELSTAAAPGGGVVSYDLQAGFETWTHTNIGEPLWIGSEQLIVSTSNDEPAPAQPFVIRGIDVVSGDEQWRVPSTAQAFESIIGIAPNRVIVTDPHPAVSGLLRVRLLDTSTGAALWESVSDVRFDGASILDDSHVALYRNTDEISTDRGIVGMLGDQSWVASRSDGIARPPEQVAEGVLVISGERAPLCIARVLREPAQFSEVLSASTEPS